MEKAVSEANPNVFPSALGFGVWQSGLIYPESLSV